MVSVLTISAIVSACGQAKKDQSHHAQVDLTFENRSGKDVDEAAIILGKYRSRFGIVVNDSIATWAFWRHPIGTNAVVQWRDSKQVTKEASVSLIGIYDPQVDGELIFSVGVTNVTVRFRNNPRK